VLFDGVVFSGELVRADGHLAGRFSYHPRLLRRPERRGVDRALRELCAGNDGATSCDMVKTIDPEGNEYDVVGISFPGPTRCHPGRGCRSGVGRPGHRYRSRRRRTGPGGQTGRRACRRPAGPGSRPLILAT
jgi:hypothetical protein